MKSIKIYSSLLALASVAGMMVSSCSFLEEVNPTGLSDVKSTPELLESNAIGMYDTPLYGSAPFLPALMAAGFGRRANTGSTYMSSPNYTYTFKYSIDDTNGGLSYIYYYPYINIAHANNFIGLLKESPVDESYKRELEAEARLLRAVAYFWIVRCFGDAPIFYASPTAANATYAPRQHYCKLYEFIISDLEFAEKNMRSPQRVREITLTQPRPNKFAATAYLSKVYVTIGSLLAHQEDNFWDNTKAERRPDFSFCNVHNAAEAYRKALDYAEKLLPESGKRDPQCEYRLLDKFGDNFNFDYNADYSDKDYDPWIHPEQILLFQQTVNCSYSSTLSRGTTPNLLPGTDGATVSSAQFGIFRPNRFVFAKWCETYPGEKGKSGSGLENVYQNSSDPRLDATFFYGYYINSNNKAIYMYPNTLTASKDNSMAYIRKYWSNKNNGTKTASNIYYMRFDEVYLNAAEAAAFLDNEPLARKYIAALHARARKSVPEGKPESEQPNWEIPGQERVFANKEELMTAIYWERVFETLGEGKEFMDNHRFGATWLSENIAKPENDFYMLPEQKQLFGTYITAPQNRCYLEDVQELRKSLLMPIPENEINTNSGIPNNKNDFSWQW